VITLSARGASEEKCIARKKKVATDLCQFVPLDPDAWMDHLVTQWEIQRRIPSLPYVRMFEAEFLEQVKIAISVGQHYDKSLGQRFSVVDSDRLRAESWEWLFCEQARDLWGLLQSAGAVLESYDFFACKVIADINAGIERAHARAA
jgi:hypothetical protein